MRDGSDRCFGAFGVDFIGPQFGVGERGQHLALCIAAAGPETEGRKLFPIPPEGLHGISCHIHHPCGVTANRHERDLPLENSWYFEWAC